MPDERPSADESAGIVVVGAGIAGLALGFHLMRAGLAVRVLEAAPRPGGTIRSELRAGYRCEWGPNGFIDNEPATTRLVEALEIGAALLPSHEEARRRWVVRAGKLRELPVNPGDFLRSDVLSPPGRLRALFEWAQPARRDTNDETVFDFALRRVGREAAEVLVDALITGVYAGDARRLSLEATFPRLRAMEREHGGLLRAMLAAGRQRHQAAGRGTPLGPVGTLHSFTSGMETLVLALAKALGTRLQCNARLMHCEPTTTGWRLDTESGVTYSARTLVLALPAWDAAALVRGFDSELAATLDPIPSAPIAVVCLGWKSTDVAHLQPGFGFLVPGRERLGILGTLFDSWIYSDRAPVDRVLWRTMIGGTRDRSAVDEDDASLVQRSLGALQKLVGVRATPEFTAVIRHARGIPQYPVGHLQRLDRLSALLEGHPGLHLTGNSYRGVALNACVREAETLAARLVSTQRGLQ